MKRSLLLLLLSAAIASAAPVGADLLADAPIITDAAWQADYTTAGAGVDFNEPLLSDWEESRTVWWKWTAPAAGTVTVTRNGTEGLAVFRGSTHDTLRLADRLASFSRWPVGATYRNTLNLAVQAGLTYSIQMETVTSPLSEAGDCAYDHGGCGLSYTSGIAAPANDSFTGRTLLTGAPVEFAATNGGCGAAEPGEPFGQFRHIPTRISAGPSAWYQWIAPAAGQYRLRLVRPLEGTYVTLYRGTALPSLGRLASLSKVSGENQITACFEAAAGEAMQLQCEGALARISIVPVPLAANDHYANAALLTGAHHHFKAMTSFASREPSEPGHTFVPEEPNDEGSVWYRWIAPSNGVIVLGPRTMPYTGSSIASLTLLARTPEPAGSSLPWASPVTPGMTVWIAATDSDGEAEFDFDFRQPLANENFTAAAALTGASVTQAFDAREAYYGTVWYAWTAPATGTVQFDTLGTMTPSQLWITTDSVYNAFGSGFAGLRGVEQQYRKIQEQVTAGTVYRINVGSRTSVGELHIGPPPAGPDNDNLADARVRTGSMWADTVDSINATSEVSEFHPGSASVWWRWTAPATGLYRVTTYGSVPGTEVEIFTGSAFPLTAVTAGSGNTVDGGGTTLLPAVAGTSYAIAVLPRSYDANTLPGGKSNVAGPVRIALDAWSAPANDLFANAIELSGVSACIHGTLMGAGAEAGEPAPLNYTADAGRSVWYHWTAPATGRVVVEVEGSEFIPGVALFSGSAVSALTELGSRKAAVVVQVTNGTAYRIAVDGIPPAGSGLSSGFRLCVTQPAAPPNDAFASRLTLTGPRATTVAAMLNASAQSGEPRHDTTTTASRSVWWTWTAPSSGLFEINTTGSSHRLIIAVYTGTALNALTPVAWDRVTTGERWSNLTFSAAAGTSYQIALDVQTGTTGTDPAVVNLAPAGAFGTNNDSFAAARTITGEQLEDTATLQGATAEPGEPAHGGVAAAKSIWWKITPGFNRRVRFWLDPESAVDAARLNIYRGTALNALTSLTNTQDTGGGLYKVTDIDLLGGVTYYIAVDTAQTITPQGTLRLGMTPPGGRPGEQLAIGLNTAPRTWDMTGCSSNLPGLGSVYPPQERWRFFHYTAPSCQRVRFTATSLPGVAVTGGDRTADLEPGELLELFVTVTQAAPVTVQLTRLPDLPPLPGDSMAADSPAELRGAPITLPVALGHSFSVSRLWKWIAPAEGIAEWKLTGDLAAGDALKLVGNAGGGHTAIYANGAAPVLRFRVSAGQPWTLGLTSENRVPRTGELSLTISQPPGVPTNDNESNALALAASWTSVTASLGLATSESAENLDSTRPLDEARQSLWYSWTPDRSDTVTLTASSPDVFIMIQNPLPGSNARRESAADSRRVTLKVAAGATYQIAVAARGLGALSAPFTLRRTAVSANDLFVTAIVLTSASASSRVDSEGASFEPGEPESGREFTPPRGTLWWRWTAPSTGLLNANTFGSGYNTVLSVYHADVPSDATRIAENDNAVSTGGVWESSVVIPVVSGTSYYFRIARAADDNYDGMAQINLSMNAPPAPYQCWLASRPALIGPAAAIDADPDGDGLTNLAELAFGTDPSAKTSDPLQPTATFNGWQAEIWLDSAALTGCGTGRAIQVQWEASADLQSWTRIPDGLFIRREGSRSLYRATHTFSDPRFLRLRVVP